MHIPYLSDDRFDYFNNNRANILALALYAREAQESIRVNTPIYPDDLPLVSKILLHESSQKAISDEMKAACVNECTEIIKEKINHKQIQVKDYAEAVVGWAIGENVSLDVLCSTLKAVVPDIKPNNHDETGEREAIKHHLNTVVTQLKPALAPTQQQTQKKYIPLSERFTIAKNSKENTHEWVIEAYKEDVRVLAEVIRESVVNAFKLEVPFVENVTEVIDKMRLDTDEDCFRKFFATVRSKVEYKKFEELEAIQQRNDEKREILDKVNKIKSDLKG